MSEVRLRSITSGPSGWSLCVFQFPKHEGSRSISTPPLDGVPCSLKGLTPNIKFSGTHLEEFSTECRKTKTKVGCTLANHVNDTEQSIAQSKLKAITQGVETLLQACHDWFWFYLGLVLVLILIG